MEEHRCNIHFGLGIRLNGSKIIAYHRNTSSSNGARNYVYNVAATRKFNADDYIELVTYNASGSNIPTIVEDEFSPIFSAVCFQ